MRSFFYPKLAITNIKKNSRFYFPYILTCIATIGMFYVMSMIAGNEGIRQMRGADALSSILGFGTIVVGIFATIFLIYTNSFLIKRRKKELGLYNILGMEKRHIARILFNEAWITGIITLAFGLVTGIIFSKLMFLILFRIIQFSVPMGFEISLSSIIMTILLFVSINVFTLIINLIQIYLSKPIELILGNNTGEKEPKSRLWLTIIGLISLISGYTIAIVTESPITAIGLFFVAVVLVIFGTYFLFIAGSITLLKILRKNNKFYYNTRHFISVSSMLYRMKQNAIGLASICILSTMVLVMVSTTVSLYVGVQDALELRYPSDISAQLHQPIVGEGEALRDDIQAFADEKNINITNFIAYKDYSISTLHINNEFVIDNYADGMDANFAQLTIISASDYQNMTNEVLDLAANEVAVYSTLKKLTNDFKLLDNDFTIKYTLDKFPISDSYGQNLFNSYFIIVKDEVVFNKIYSSQKEMLNEYAADQFYRISFDMDAQKTEKIDFYLELSNYVYESTSFEYIDKAGNTQITNGSDRSIYFDSKQENEAGFYSMYGGFLFLGLFLGLLFMVATVLIIYYKQISEGYDDSERYSILKKVGMSYDEIKASIRSQILIIFYLPITFAIIHIAFAFKMITKLLVLFNLTNVNLFMLCTFITIIIFTIVYGIVYSLTAKVYYRIVK